jgi:hypothetical protein
MSFRYNGGDCSQSFNIQESDLFTCEDFNGGPPREEGTLSYVQAFELGGGEMYFEGFVPVGDLFTLDADEKVSANMNITIYDPAGSQDPAVIVSPENLLQTVKYHSSCSRGLFLKDRFGSSQLVEFVSEDQGLITCFINATLTVSLSIPISAEAETVRLTGLGTLSNIYGFVNKTDEVNGIIISPGMPYKAEPIDITIDLTVRQRYTFFTAIVGETIDGEDECNGSDFFEFTAGNPLPPIFPTLAPTTSPTITPYPTPDPKTSPCELAARVRCVVLDGPTSSCQALTAPLVDQCNGADNSITNLRFQYTGGNCDGLENCDDRDGGPSGVEEVYMEAKDKDGKYFSGVAKLGDFVDIPNPAGFSEGTIDIDVFTVDPDEEDSKGDRLQQLELSTECLNPSDPGEVLVLGNGYGGVTFSAFTSVLDGEQTIFAEVQVSYIAANDGPLPAILSSGIVDSFFSGPGQELIATPESLDRFESKTLLVEKKQVNLRDEQGRTLVFGLFTQGTADTSGMVECSDSTLLFFTVGPVASP